jgi:hypothetical protein
LPHRDRTFVVIPCGKAKIWQRYPDLSAVHACDAYIGTPFRVNRRYAESCGCPWYILSAKYGLLRPDDLIVNYNVTFNKQRTGPISVENLRRQVNQLGLGQFSAGTVLGGKKYCGIITAAFDGSPVKLSFPFRGLPLGKSLAAVKKVTAAR